MKFSISSGELLKQLQKASGAIGNNPVIAILEDYLFEVKNDVLTIAATDLETSIVMGIDVMSDEDGKIAIPGKMLMETLKALPEQPVTFSVNKDTYGVELTSAFGKYKLAGDNPSDFPEIPIPESVDSFKLEAGSIHNAIGKTTFATSSDELRQAMTGINVVVDFNKLIFVATDAHKLVKYTFTDLVCDTTTSFIIPKKAFTLIRQALPSSGEIEVSFNSSNVFFEIDNTKIACRLIDAKYPEYDAVIPKENPNVMTVDRKDFLSSLKRIAIYANKTTNQVTLNINNDSLTINAQDLDFSNEANEQLTCDYEGEPMTIGFNAKFLIDMLNALEDDQIELHLSEPTRAGIIVPSNQKDGEDLLMLIMPVMMNY